MTGHSSVIYGWSRTEESVFGSEVFGQASMEGCEGRYKKCPIITFPFFFFEENLNTKFPRPINLF